MAWRDFFYFSKGERSGLIVLLCLITIAGILLLVNNNAAKHIESQTTNVNINTNNNVNSRQTQSEKINQNNDNAVDLSEKIQSNDNSSNALPAVNNNSISVSNNSKETESVNRTESISERVNRLTSTSRTSSYERIEKYEEGTIVELNSADTTILKKIPGIGSTFAKRIVSYRNLLGGYYSVTQLSEVYGIDEDRYISLNQWFSADPMQISKIQINTMSQDSLQRHPYINYAQARVLIQLRRQKGKLTGWENLQLLSEFTESDRIRLQHYLSFE